ncbi:MAG: FAD-binding protein [Chloroflexota bacterium]|nr:FAD-binding protein [Chloroflexota bacterium]
MQTTQSPYAPMTPAIVAQLQAIVGAQHVIFGDTDRMQDYSHDEVVGAEYRHMPDVVVKPRSADEISAIIKLANRARIPVTPRGAGSGLSGGAVPVFGGILLSVERMNHILEVDRANMVAVVEPGVVTNAINDAVQDFGLFYAGYPMSLEMCFIGGNVAENAGGGRAIKYGVTSRYVMGLEVVLPTGEIVTMGGKRVKDVTGYDLLHLMVGSEGTLGVFTKIILRLTPQPVARAVCLVPFPDVASAIGAVPRVMTQGRIVPSSVEFMDRLTVETIYAYVGEALPHPQLGALLLLEVDAFSQEQAEAEYTAIVSICLEAGALDVYVGDTPAKIKKMWKPRQIAAEAFKAIAPEQSAEDLVVPLAQIPRFVPEVERLSREHGVRMPVFGHAGDGNLHVHVMKKPEMSSEEWHTKLPGILEELYRVVAGLGGTISGEHGIGSKRARYLSIALDPKLIELQKRIKRVFDPNNILNPGKIFPA